MPMTRRVMVDIETLGLEPGASVLSIGAVEFDTDGYHPGFYGSITRESCEEAGLTVDEDTVEWWQDQPDEARKQLEGGDDLADVLEEFAEFVDGADEVWANSPSFDCELLIEAGRRVGVPMPWEFYEERDHRTLKSLPVAVDVGHEGVKHNALDDATHQARVASETLRRLEAAAMTPETTEQNE